MLIYLRFINRLSYLYFLGVSVKMKGEANTSWTEDKQKLNNEGRYEDEKQLLTGHEEYFSMNYYVFGSSTGKSYIILFIAVNY